jgi:phospholipid/cholesterol/gamma-HCH transport system substrate-binding protein
MITRSTQVKVIVFALLGVVVIAFTGLHYANLGQYFGAPGYYVVKVDLADAGGVYTNADVTYRGVHVGRVGAMNLTSDGIQLDLNISDTAPRIPANVQVVVADLSAVGEQYVDLLPRAAGKPYLTSNSIIHQRDTQVPPPVTTLLTSLDALANSLPTKSLQTVVNELGHAFQGQGPNLQILLQASSSFTRAASNDIPQTTQLINDGQSVLATQQDESSELKSFGASAALLAKQLDSSDSDLRRLISAAPQASEQVTGLLQDNDPSLGIVLANLLTTSDLTLTRSSGLEELLSGLPAVAAAGSTVITSHGASLGLALTFFDPLPCTTGYGGTSYRNGLDLSPPPPLDTGARCTEPASQGEVRGSAHAPSGGGIPPAAKP